MSSSIDVRCDKKKHAEIVAPGIIEVKCDSRFCGAGAGVVVLHRFSSETGELLETNRYNDPLGRRSNNAADNHSASVRSA